MEVRVQNKNPAMEQLAINLLKVTSISTFLVASIVLEHDVPQMQHSCNHSVQVSLLLSTEPNLVHGLLKAEKLLSIVDGWVTQRGWVQILITIRCKERERE